MKTVRILGLMLGLWFVLLSTPTSVDAANIARYSNVLSDSAPAQFSNHSFRFQPTVEVGSGALIQITLPGDFALSSDTELFSERNVQLYINGIPRVASSTSPVPGVDQVVINRVGIDQIQYVLAPDAAISANSRFELRVGNHTSLSLPERTLVSTTTGTTTLAADIEPIRNSSDLGTHEISMEIFDGGLIADTDFVVFLNEKVGIGPVDTTEEIPPFRFNGAPTSTVGGTTLSVEISLETNELAVCKYDLVASTTFAVQPFIFSSTGQLVHTTVVSVTPDSLQRFFVRCIDDEDNFNITDYLIEFTVSAQPTGTSNTDGDVSGDGTGSGNDGTGSGSGGGGTSGASEGQEPTAGGSTGSGGSGGGGGGGSGRDNDNEAGGGFESSDGPFESGDGRVTISGTAFPGATVTILADGQRVDTVTANNSGVYSITIDEIARGAYTFGVFASDAAGTRSTTFSTSFTISGARASRLSNINIPPTILITPNPAEPGETLELSGYALPDATVTIAIDRDDGSGARSLTALSDSRGRWTSSLDTTGFARDTYRARVRAEQVDGARTNLSDYTFFGIGQAADRPLSPDLNRDGSVNLIDFSIMLFWWQTDGGDSEPPADINQDGNVSLTDFSILLFNWTG